MSTSVSCMYQLTRCSARLAMKVSSTETFWLCTESALFRQQGVVGPSRPCLARDLRTSHDRHQLLQQLRTLPLPGKADPSHHHQGFLHPSPCRSMATPEGTSATGLAAMSKTMPGRWRSMLEQGQIGKPGQYRRPQRAHQYPRCADDLRPARRQWIPNQAGSHRRLISFVADRPGHDRRYAIDAGKLERELGWRAQENFETGIEKTVRWYIDHHPWWRAIFARGYKAQRVGLSR